MPERAPLRPALWLAGIFAAVTFLIHFISSLWGSHLGYGFFRDELYFLVCGHHLAWGYVDQAPLVALQARIAETLFGLSPTGIRVLSFAAGGINVALTGLIAWQFGGRRTAQALAMMALLAAPVFLGNSNYLSMNSFESPLWMGALLVLLRIADGSSHPRAWLVFGLLCGIAIENKHSTAFFVVALLIALIISPQRRMLLSKWMLAGVGVLILLALPNFIWQVLNHFPTYELLNGIAHTDKNIKLPPLAFLREQVNMLLILSAPLWIGGLICLAFSRHGRPWRFVPIAYLIFLGLMMAMHAKDYYVAPFYPVLFAAGAVAFADLTQRNWPLAVYTRILAVTLIVATGPVMLTILPPDKYSAYASRLGANKVKSEKFTSPLPQYLSDRFGWPQMVEGFAARYNALPPDVRARTGIFCGNYGEASAVNVLGAKYGLPTAISGHQNYFYWGWNGYTGESMLTLGNDPADYKDSWDEVIDLGPFDAPWIMDHEHHHYFWLRHRKRTYAQDWPELKYWY
jgi:dolichyl-phosphate-mannose-protein mannosyltransferase